VALPPKPHRYLGKRPSLAFPTLPSVQAAPPVLCRRGLLRLIPANHSRGFAEIHKPRDRQSAFAAREFAPRSTLCGTIDTALFSSVESRQSPPRFSVNPGYKLCFALPLGAVFSPRNVALVSNVVFVSRLLSFVAFFLLPHSQSPFLES
jgi:hypothetical protein